MQAMNDEFYMSLALKMAEAAQGQTGINPVVGCVIVKDGQIVGLGSHLRQGGLHAEIHALQMAGSAAQGCSMYVTLEPCSHYGATPPCVQRIVDEKVRRVVIACEDPNPSVSGSGIALLRRQGIQVQVGLLCEQAQRMNEKFIKYITTRLPFVTLKTASTLDGKIAARSGDSKWVSNDAVREIVHVMRHQHQAIMVGIGTVMTDNPKLSTRLPVKALHPTRIVVDSSLRLPLHCNVVTHRCAPTIVVTTDEADEQAATRLQDAGVTVIRCGPGPRVQLTNALQKLGELHIGSILLEGGGALNGEMIQRKLVDRIHLFIAPKLVGSVGTTSSFLFPGVSHMNEAIQLDQLEVKQIDNNISITGIPFWPS